LVDTNKGLSQLKIALRREAVGWEGREHAHVVQVEFVGVELNMFGLVILIHLWYD